MFAIASVFDLLLWCSWSQNAADWLDDDDDDDDISVFLFVFSQLVSNSLPSGVKKKKKN